MVQISINTDTTILTANTDTVLATFTAGDFIPDRLLVFPAVCGGGSNIPGIVKMLPDGRLLAHFTSSANQNYFSANCVYFV